MGSWCPADQHFTISRIRKIFQVSSLKYNQSYLYTVSIGTNESYSDPYTCFCAWLNTFIQSLSCFFGTLSRTGKKKVTSNDPLRNSDVSGRVWLRYNADDLLQSRPYTPYNPSQLFRHPYRFRLPTASDDTTHCSTYFQWPWRQLTWITWITVGAIKYWYLFLVEAFWEEKQVLFHYTLSWRHGTQLSQSLYILKRLRDWILRTKRLPQLDQPLLNLCTPDLAFLLLHSC